MNIQDVRKGDIVRFASYALRVEAEPVRANNAVTLTGRTSIDGSPIVTKKFIGTRDVTVDRP